MAIYPAPMTLPGTAEAALNLTVDQHLLRLKRSVPPCPTGTCAIPLHIFIGFDGTNNNMDRDTPNRAHTNVARLFQAFPDATGKGNANRVGHYRSYIPGVGTPFPENREWRESADGKAGGWGARARVMMGIADVFNAVRRYLQNNEPLLKGLFLTEFIQEKNGMPGGTRAPSVADNHDLRLQRVYAEMHDHMERVFKMAASHTPQPGRLGLGPINVHVFGFSRGAMEAVAFCHEFAKAFPKGTLCGVPISIHFLGLMDCVASVLLADTASRLGLAPAHGHAGEGTWVTQALPGCVKKAVHFVAAHEQRTAFPLDMVQGADMDTYIYPGVHSNVGGGYGLDAQGRAPKEGLMLSQIPLIHMHKLATSYGVPFLPYAYMGKDSQDDFALEPRLAQAWNSYMMSLDYNYVRSTQGAAAAKPFFEALNPNGLAKCQDYKQLIRQHMRMRYSQLARYFGSMYPTKDLPGTLTAQEDEDLRSSQVRLTYDRALMELLHGEGSKEHLIYDRYQQEHFNKIHPKANLFIAQYTSRRSVPRLRATFTDFDPPWIEWAYAELEKNCKLSEGHVVGSGHLVLLHEFVNDSLAGFYFLGYSSDAEKAEKIEDVVAKHQAGQKLSPMESRIYAGYRERVEDMGDENYKEIIQVRLRDKKNLDAEAYQKKWAYTPAEAKYLSSSKSGKTVIPVLTDADVPMLLEDTGIREQMVIPLMTTTRGEGGGYLLQRGVFIGGKHQSLLG